MSSEKYIGLDVHQATISVAVLDSTGKLIMESILETKASTILEFLAGLRGTLSVTFEEGSWAAWLYDLLKPHVAELVVCNPRKLAVLKDGNKSDKIDARKLAERLRLNDLKPVYHGETGVRMLRELARSYLTIVKDLSRVMNRLKALYRSWAIPCAGRDVYYQRQRSEWLGKIVEAGVRRRAEQLYQQLDMLQHLRQQARRELLAESRKHRITAKLRQIPSLGPIRSARPTASIQKADFHSRPEQESQSRSKGFVQGRGDPGQHTARTLSGVLPALAGQRHQADYGAPHPGAEDRSHYADTVEERSQLRRRETEVTSR